LDPLFVVFAFGKTFPEEGKEAERPVPGKICLFYHWCLGFLMRRTVVGGTSRIKDLAHHSLALGALQLRQAIRARWK
jgi:hypothetical protein